MIVATTAPVEAHLDPRDGLHPAMLAPMPALDRRPALALTGLRSRLPACARAFPARARALPAGGPALPAGGPAFTGARSHFAGPQPHPAGQPSRFLRPMVPHGSRPRPP